MHTYRSWELPGQDSHYRSAPHWHHLSTVSTCGVRVCAPQPRRVGLVGWCDATRICMECAQRYTAKDQGPGVRPTGVSWYRGCGDDLGKVCALCAILDHGVHPQHPAQVQVASAVRRPPARRRRKNSQMIVTQRTRRDVSCEIEIRSV